MEAIFSAADIGFRGSLHTTVLTSPAAYMGTITGCFLLPVKIKSFTDKLTIFLVSIPKEHKSFLLLWDSVHTSISSLHTKVSPVLICLLLASRKRFKEIISSSISRTGMEGKQTSNIRSRRLSNVV
uniref:Uncharacterized protein n=1 Tax=Terrapene triunguis TaxID=2587831 RepID=A0A674J8Y3_9SAUR